MTIEVYGWTCDEFEKMALAKIHARLGHDRKGMLKLFKAGSLAFDNTAEAIQHRLEAERCYEVNGFLSLNDEKDGRGFRFLIEKCLSWKQLQDLADQLAAQIDKCADRMLSDRKRGVRKCSVVTTN